MLALRPGSRPAAQALEAEADLRALGLVRLDERQPRAADLVAEQVQRRLDRDRVPHDLEDVERGLRLGLELPRAVLVAVAVAADHLLDLRADDVRVDADAAQAAEADEREDQVVVARVEVEIHRDDPLRLFEIGVRLLDRADGRDQRQLRDRLRLEVQHHAGRDVVDDDRQVADGSDRLEVLDDAARRRLVVVRRHDEDRVDARLARALGQVDGMRRRVRARPGDDGGAVSHLVDRDAEELDPLVVGERRRLAGRAGDDEAVAAVLHQVPRHRPERVVVDLAVRVERRDDSGQDLAEHRSILLPRGREASYEGPKPGA